MTTRSRPLLRPSCDKGVALIIVLAFVVLLSGLVVAYLSRSNTDRQLAKSSFDDTAADLLARSALDVIIGDFKQEIADGSNYTFGRYTPLSNDDIVPRRSGNPSFAQPETNDPIPNLIRRSVYPDNIPAHGVPSRASAVNSTTNISANGRSISLNRWNSHYLLPRHDPSLGTGSTPMSPVPPPYGPGDSTGFIPPDWIIVTRDGPTPFSGWNSALADANSTNGSYAIGRYAYAVYDEGGLLDINVAGYPTSVSPSTTDIGRKGVLTFADLTTLPTTPGNTVTTTAINKFILFRNYATTQSSSTLGAATSFSASGTQSFVDYFLGNPQIGTNQDFRTVRKLSPSAGRTDQNFITRAEFISFRSSANIANPNTLQYLGTFSREKNASTWRVAPVDPLANRFAIGKLAEVVPNPSDPAVVKADFGLVWNSDHWEYWGATGSAEQSNIPAITGSSTPDFFQLLSYGRSNAPIGETLTIGASLIDQYDTDNITTVIEYAGGPPPRAYGMEALPSPTPWPAPPPPAGAVILNRPFRNVGEFGYAYKTTTTTLDFKSNNVDAGLLDLFTYNTASQRSGIVNLNARQPCVLAAILKGVLTTEASTSSDVTSAPATNAANTIVNATGAPGGAALSRADISRLASLVTTTPFSGSTSEEVREAISRALAEVTQTRTWGLLIDVIAQAGRYPPTATGLSKFVVQGEKRYWLHIAIDRFTGEVIDQQFEAVYE